MDFQTAQDGTVTLRERDSTKQIRSTIETVVSLVTELANDRVTWEEVMAKHPVFVAQEL